MVKLSVLYKKLKQACPFIHQKMHSRTFSRHSGINAGAAYIPLVNLINR
jgi:predicted phage-related endonuclease